MRANQVIIESLNKEIEDVKRDYNEIKKENDDMKSDMKSIAPSMDTESVVQPLICRPKEITRRKTSQPASSINFFS